MNKKSRGTSPPVAMITREFPPHVYGGGGVHVEFLVRALRAEGVPIDVHCFGPARDGATAHAERDDRLGDANPALHVVSADLVAAAAVAEVGLVHSHTWYANLAGVMAKLLYDIPHVVTAHSLEPLRPWKAEQLGGGYRLSGWAERMAIESADAVIAVSSAMRDDVIDCYPSVDAARVHVIHNGIDTTLFQADSRTEFLERHGVDLRRPYIAFVGRLARQKGLVHLLRAMQLIDADVQLVVLAGAADTPQYAAEVDVEVDRLRARRRGVVVVEGMVARADLRQVLTHATVFCCPSVYEPMGIVNLEAMACGTAVVAAAVGGIPEVVVDGQTGTLVHHDPADPTAFEDELARALTEALEAPVRTAQMGRAGRDRAVAEFSWMNAARKTAEIYRTLTG